MTLQKKEDRIFEIYQLHTELAERVAALGEGLNKVYLGMVSGVVAGAVLVHKLLPSVELKDWIFPSLGLVVSISWSLGILSINGRLAAKKKVLQDYERQLGIDFIKQEEDEFRRHKISSVRRVISAEFMPLLLSVAYAYWIIYLLVVRCFAT